MAASFLPNVQSAIHSGDADALRSLLAAEPSLANEPIAWGKRNEIRTHPLHYVSDMLFDGTLQRGREIPLIAVLLEAGADFNHQAENGETPLIGAASLNAEDVGLALLDAGARPGEKGIWDATALHWASMLGLQRLVARLVQVDADLNLADTRYAATPIEWAIHGHFESTQPPPPGNHIEVVKLLVAAGARVKPEWMAAERVQSDPAMLAALSSH